MNQELLKRLQLEAGGSHYPDINPDLQARFAELIVRECAIFSMVITDDHYDVDALYKHFGVES